MKINENICENLKKKIFFNYFLIFNSFFHGKNTSERNRDSSTHAHVLIHKTCACVMRFNEFILRAIKIARWRTVFIQRKIDTWKIEYL